MQLVEARVRLFWNIVDSGWVRIEPNVTALVGRNESGKTAFMRALYRLNPALPDQNKPTVINDYPRWRESRDKRQRPLEQTEFVAGRFLPNEDDRRIISGAFQPGLPFDLPESTYVRVERDYADNMRVALELKELDLILALADACDLPDAIDRQLRACESLDQAQEIADEYIAKSKTEATGTKRGTKAVQQAVAAAKKLLLEDLPAPVVESVRPRIPRLFYFSQYNTLPGRIDLQDLLTKAKGKQPLTEQEQTSLSLLSLASVSGEEFQAEDFESRIAELEAAANFITGEVFQYWSTNQDLVVQLQIDQQRVTDQRGQSVVHRYLDVRLNDQRHMVTTNLDRRSAGFHWFFSFIAAFSEYDKTNGSVLVLLDEPGLNLHARAQADFLRFINERLGSKHQVLYTTHSPFMVESGKLERVRLVQDNSSRSNPDLGCQISSDFLAVERDTLFPLQGALGYDLAQNLFIGPHNLVVEGPADFIYLRTLSDVLVSLGRTGLNQAWSIIPVGGADKVPTFVALLGNHLDVTVLLDVGSKPNQKLADLCARGLLEEKRIVLCSQVVGTPEADIEDLFEISEYLQLHNWVFRTDVQESDLATAGPILRRLERCLGRKFSHDDAATELLRHRADFLSSISAKTLDRFEALFNVINNTDA